MNQLRYFLIAASCTLATAVSAQWVWIDKNGVKAFSDRPPPAEILEKNILKRPGAAPVLTPEPMSAPGAAAAPASSASAAVPSGLDKALAEKKKKAEEAELAQRKAVEEKNRVAKADNCVRAKQAKASYESGLRIRRVNAKGEIEVLDDAARAAEVKRIQAIIDSDCV